MTQTAKVFALDGEDRAVVEVIRRSACSGDCKSCGGCSGDERVMRVRALNRVNAAVGDRVVIESSTKKVLALAWVAYVLPIILMVAFYFLPVGGEGMKIACSFAGLALGVGICVLYSGALGRKRDYSAEIVEILRK